MQAILGFVPDHRLRSVDHAVGDLLAALRRQAVHQQRARLGAPHQLLVDPVGRHDEWQRDIEETEGHRVTYPLIGDSELKVATLYDMLPAGAGTSSQGRSAADNATVRSVFVIGPDKKIKAMLTYPMSTGRNFDEVLRILDSVQLTAKHQIATPVNWKPGDDVIISPAVSNEEAQKRYPGGWKSPKPYLRYVPQPH